MGHLEVFERVFCWHAAVHAVNYNQWAPTQVGIVLL